MSSDPWSIEEYQAMIHRPISITVPDGILRYKVKSRKTKDEHTVELDSYDGNGQCSCQDFVFNLERHLRRGLTGRQAFESGKIEKLRPWQFSPDDALRCFHICEARREFATAIIAGVIKMQREQARKIHA